MKRTKPGVTTIWTESDLQFLTTNFYSMTNSKLAEQLNMTLTVVRNKCYELGLKRMEMEYWTEEQLSFLKAHYKTKGDVEIAEALQLLFPKKKSWTKNHIEKKRKYLGLLRTPDEVSAIRSRHSSEGGRAHTIRSNSGSVNLADNYVANTLAWRNKSMQKIMLQHPELIELKRNQLKLNRAINEHSR